MMWGYKMLNIIFNVIRKIFKWIWGGGNGISRINFNVYYAELKYPTPFIEQHKSAPGVDEVYKKLKKAHDDFRKKRANVKEMESSYEEQLFNKWKKIRLAKIISKRLLVVSLLLSIIGDNIDSNIMTSLVNLIGIIFILSIPTLTISKLIEIVIERKYDKFFKRIKQILLSFRTEYLKIKALLEQEMDELCLSSLNELELTKELHRREIEQFKELQRQSNEVQKQTNKSLSSLNRQVETLNEETIKNSKDLNKIKKKLWIDD